jgi:DNA-directed RNA polymerase subunit RPC12/RpoP
LNIISTILVVVFLILGISILLFLDVKYKENHNYQCTKCLHKFDIFENQLNSYRISGKLHVKCPKCGQYSAVKIIKKE